MIAHSQKVSSYYKAQSQRRRPPFGTGARWLAFALLSSLPLAACQCEDPALSRALPPDAVINTFAQAQVSKIDILWVIDNSKSMIEEQQNLADNLASFFRFLDEGKVDYQIGVTTTDAVGNAGRLVGSPAILTPSTPGVLEAFQANVRVGTSGRALEQGLAAAEAALASPNQKFLRPDAFLFVIFVSDENDHSFGEMRYYWRGFEQMRGIGNEDSVSLSAIIGPPNDPTSGAGGGCSSEAGVAAAGDRYALMAEETGGLWGSICDASFDTTLEALGAAAVGLKRKFFLTDTPDPETLEVYFHFACDARPSTLTNCSDLQDSCDAKTKDAQDYYCRPAAGRPNGWVYEEETNAVFFVGDSVPPLKSTVEIIYQRPGHVITK